MAIVRGVVAIRLDGLEIADHDVIPAAFIEANVRAVLVTQHSVERGEFVETRRHGGLDGVVDSLVPSEHDAMTQHDGLRFGNVLVGGP